MSGKKLKQCLIFGGGINSPDSELIEQQLDELDKKRDFTPSDGRPSAYVQVFEKMVRTVLECEPDLLSIEEIEILERFSMLCYSARYCLVRLLLRTSNRWYPVSSLESFKKEVGEDGLAIAIKDLCSLFTDPGENGGMKAEAIDTVKFESPEADVVVKQEDTPGIMDLSMDLDDEDVKFNFATALPLTVPLTKDVFDELWPQRAGTSQPRLPADPIHSLLDSDISSINMDAFCQNESMMTTRELLDRIAKDQLVVLAKEMRCKLRPNLKKNDIIDALEKQAANQQVLDFSMPLTKKAKGKARADGLQRTQLSFFKVPHPSMPKKNQEQRLRELAIKRLGPCIRVNIEFYRLVRRLHIIYFRETEIPTNLLLPALLSIFRKRNFTPVIHTRTSQVWASRQDLLEYERALGLHKLLDDDVEEPKESVPRRITKTPTSSRDRFTTPGSGRAFSTLLKTPASTTSVQPKSEWDAGAPAFDPDEEVVRTTREQIIKRHFDDWVYPGWQGLVAIECNGVRPRPIGLERFDAGHVYTRMVHKALENIAKLKDYQFELKVLDALLDQRFWCRGKRAKWHTRRAIALGHLVTKEKNPLEKRELQLRILDGIKVALLDDDTGIVHRPNLVKRLHDHEKKLKISLEDRSRCGGELREAPFVSLKATRVHSLSFDANSRPIGDKGNTPDLHKFILVNKKDSNTVEDKPMKKAGKSSWQGRDGQVVNVETCALEHYQDHGYKGFHCETRILTTLFGLLFWDVIFAEVPGAFETPYQAAPLDLFYDSFYRARKELIDNRLQEIQDDKAREILEKHDKAHRDNAIMCVGVNWELCSREDLLEIVDCIGGQTLSMICRIFCEDYDGRRSGGPDLFVWNVKTRKCKFVEVKGPGDTPQENQKLWFDSLLRANAEVEICYVKDAAQGSDKQHRTKTSSSSTRRKRATVSKDDSESEEQDYDKLDYHDELPASDRPNKRLRMEEVKGDFESPTKQIQSKFFKIEVDPTTSKVGTR